MNEYPREQRSDGDPHNNGVLQDLYQRYWKELCKFLQAKFGSPPEPEDIAQAAFVKYAALDEPDKVENPKSFLFRTANNLVIDYHRSPKNVLASDEEQEYAFSRRENSDVLGPETVFMSKQEMAIMEQVIMSLSERDRAFVLMNRLEDMTYTEIAKQAGMSRSGVQKIITQALEKCSNALQQATQKNESWGTHE